MKGSKLDQKYNVPLRDNNPAGNASPSDHNINRSSRYFEKFVNSVKKASGTLRKHKKIVAIGATAAYEGTLGKLLYDLNNVLSNPIVRAEVWRGKLPNGPNVYANLAPWPSITEIATSGSPTFIFTKSMGFADYALRAFNDNPVLKGIAITAPLILVGTYYGVEKYRQHRSDRK